MMELTKKEIGNWGEKIAVDYLKENGHKILDRNHSCRYGEIDIISRNKNDLYFIEIKTRRGTHYGPAIESLSPQKLNKIRKTATYLLNQKKDWSLLIPHLSVLAIDEDPEGELNIEFLPDAFE